MKENIMKDNDGTDYLLVYPVGTFDPDLEG